jgi:hypothetical protein
VAFAGAGVADGAESDFVALVGKVCLSVQSGAVAEHLARLCQAQQARHLASGGAHVRAGIGLGHQVLPVAIIVQAAGREVAVHAAAGAARVGVHIGVGVQLREPLLHGELADGEHEGHVAVVATAPIAIAELFGHGHLGQFLAIAEDAELGFAGKHLLATQQAGFAAFVHDAVIAEYLLAHLFQGHAFLCGGGLFLAVHPSTWVVGSKGRAQGVPGGGRLPSALTTSHDHGQEHPQDPRNRSQRGGLHQCVARRTAARR